MKSLVLRPSFPARGLPQVLADFETRPWVGLNRFKGTFSVEACDGFNTPSECTIAGAVCILSDPEQAMQFGRRCRVLQQGLSCRVHDGGCTKSGKGGFVKTTQDEFFLARVGVDIAHSEDA